MTPTFFAKPSDFRKWLQKNHTKESELLVGFYKVGSGKPSITWPESVDEALCFGWIDGIRRSIDSQSYSIRFTPRKSTSIWSAINIKKIAELVKKGLMQPAGLAAFEKRQEKKSAIYAYEKEAVKLSPAYLKKLKSNKKAFDYFKSQGNYYQKRVTNWIMSAKSEATQLSRLTKFIALSEAGQKI